MKCVGVVCWYGVLVWCVGVGVGVLMLWYVGVVCWCCGMLVWVCW